MKTPLLILLCSLVACAPGYVFRLHFDKNILIYSCRYPISLDMKCEQDISTVACTFEFTNIANEDYCLLKTGTPLEGLLSPFIAVSQDGVPIQYKGINMYRFPPERHDFVYLTQSETVSATIKITDAFVLPSTGHYRINYVYPVWYFPRKKMDSHIGEIDAEMSAISSKSVDLKVEDSHVFFQPVKEELAVDDSEVVTINIEGCGRPTFIGGTESDRNKILRVHKRLCSQLTTAKNNVKNNDFYKTWFGQYTDDRSDRVRDILQKTKEGLTEDGVTYYMNGPQCTLSIPAYTLTYSPSTIYLCPVFHWYVTAADCKVNAMPSKEGILAREWTRVFAGTEDFNMSGEENSKLLAVSHPDKAINHTDSYEYYYCLSYWQ